MATEGHLRTEILASETRVTQQLDRLHTELVAQQDTLTRHVENHAIHAA
jgi:hypothetical protein